MKPSEYLDLVKNVIENQARSLVYGHIESTTESGKFFGPALRFSVQYECSVKVGNGILPISIYWGVQRLFLSNRDIHIPEQADNLTAIELVGSGVECYFIGGKYVMRADLEKVIITESTSVLPPPSDVKIGMDVRDAIPIIIRELIGYINGLKVGAR